MFCLMGKVVDLVFEEEIKEFGSMPRNIFVGMLTGGLYKTALGMRPALVGSVLGGGIIVGLTYMINGMNDYGLIEFRMEM